MGEPARKLDPEERHPQPRRRVGHRGRVVPLRRRGAAARPAERWVLTQVVRWYRTRRD